jgi:glycosyltransferase involved in cell wall biosynthesis
MNVLTISTLYPNESQPVHALFVEQRVRAMAKRFPVRVVCPIPWFPITQGMARYRHRKRIPLRETRHGIEVHYPRFVSVPRFLKPLDGVFLALTCLWTAWRLRGTFRFDRIDANLAFPDGWGAIFVGRLFGAPVTITLRGHDVNDLPQFPVRRRQVAWALRRAGAVFAVADALRDGAIQLGAAPANTFTIGNGVDPEKFRPIDRAEARRALGLPLDAPLVLSVGHLVERKGFHHLVNAWSRVRERLPNARLVIVGGPGEEGDFSQRLARTISEKGMGAFVTLPGAVPHEQLATWFSAADVLCLASEKEGRANVLLEAIACGTPIVATRVWGTPEIVTDERYGLLVDAVTPDVLGDAIVEALERTWDRDAIVAHAASFSWEGTAAEMDKVLRSLGGSAA